MATTTSFPAHKEAMDVHVLGGSVDSETTGSPDDAAWSGTGDATVISLLKAIHAQLVIIAGNTTPADPG